MIDIILAETKLQLPRPIIADANTTDIDAVNRLKYFMRKGRDLKPTSFLTRSLYSLQMDNWMKIFKKENFLVLQKDVLKNSSAVFHKIEKFLKLKHQEVDPSELEYQWKWPELTKIVEGKGSNSGWKLNLVVNHTHF